MIPRMVFINSKFIFITSFLRRGLFYLIWFDLKDTFDFKVGYIIQLGKDPKLQTKQVIKASFATNVRVHLFNNFRK